MDNNNYDINKIKVPRTIDGTIMEGIAIVLLIVAWVISLARHQFAGEAGEEVLISAIITSGSVLLLLFCSHFVWFNKNAQKLRNMHQVMLTVRMNRVLAIEFALGTLFNSLTDNLIKSHPVLVLAYCFFIVITGIFFTFLIHKAKYD